MKVKQARELLARSLNKAEQALDKRYSVFRAFVWAILLFRPYS